MLKSNLPSKHGKAKEGSALNVKRPRIELWKLTAKTLTSRLNSSNTHIRMPCINTKSYYLLVISDRVSTNVS